MSPTWARSSNQCQNHNKPISNISQFDGFQAKNLTILHSTLNTCSSLLTPIASIVDPSLTSLPMRQRRSRGGSSRQYILTKSTKSRRHEQTLDLIILSVVIVPELFSSQLGAHTELGSRSRREGRRQGDTERELVNIWSERRGEICGNVPVRDPVIGGEANFHSLLETYVVDQDCAGYGELFN